MSTALRVRELLATGMTNKQIARKAGVAPCTVKYHVSRIMAATGAVNRTQAAIAIRDDANAMP